MHVLVHITVCVYKYVNEQMRSFSLLIVILTSLPQCCSTTKQWRNACKVNWEGVKKEEEMTCKKSLVWHTSSTHQPSMMAFFSSTCVSLRPAAKWSRDPITINPRLHFPIINADVFTSLLYKVHVDASFICNRHVHHTLCTRKAQTSKISFKHKYTCQTQSRT